MTDWSTVPHPPWWHERATARRALLDAAVERVREVVRSTPEIVGALVFGSYVSGTIGPESDLDMMVVTTIAADGDKGGRYARLSRLLDLHVSCDLLIYEPAEFEQLANTRSFVAQARANGIWMDATTSA